MHEPYATPSKDDIVRGPFKHLVQVIGIFAALMAALWLGLWLVRNF